MRIVDSFDPAAPDATHATSFNCQASNGAGRIVVYNESNINMQLQWGGFTTYCPAWYAVLYCVQAGTPNIQWSVQSILTAGPGPISQVLIELYDNSETIQGTFPAPINRNFIGNTIPVNTAATNVSNDGNTVQNVIEATLAGSAGSNLLARNDGTFVIRQFVSSVLTTLFDVTPGAGAGASNVFLSDPAHVTEVLGNLLVDAVLTATGGIVSHGGLTVTGGGTGLDSGAWSTDGSGVQTCKKVNFTNGSISDIKIAGPYTVTNVATFFNHNLGVTPDFVSVLLANTSGGGVFSCNADIATATSTQVKLSSNSVSGITVYILSFKF